VNDITGKKDNLFKNVKEYEQKRNESSSEEKSKLYFIRIISIQAMYQKTFTLNQV